MNNYNQDYPKHANPLQNYYGNTLDNSKNAQIKK